MSQICVLDIDLKGSIQIQKSIPDCVFVFVDVPSLEVLKARLVARGTESIESLERRLHNAREELELVKTMPTFTRIMNDDLERCYAELRGLIRLRYHIDD